MGIILSPVDQHKHQVVELKVEDSLLFGVTREDPLWLDHGDAELESLLVLNSGTSDRTARRAHGARSRSRSGAHKVGSVYLDLVAPFRTHLPERRLRVLEEDFVFNRSEADGDARSVGHGVRAHAE